MANLLSWLPIQSSIVSQNMNPANWQNSSIFNSGLTGGYGSYTQQQQPKDSYTSSAFGLPQTGSSQDSQMDGLLQLLSIMLMQLLNGQADASGQNTFSLASPESETKASNAKSQKGGSHGAHGCSGAHKSKTGKADKTNKTNSSSNSNNSTAIAASSTSKGYQKDNVGVPKGTKLSTNLPDGVVKQGDDYVVTKAGTVIDGKDIKGTLIIKADNVTIKNSKVEGNSYWGVRVNEGVKGTVIEDSEISAPRSADSVVAGDNLTIRRANLHGASDGMKAGSNTLVEDSWIHDLANGPEDHSDGIQIMGGENIVIRGNRIEEASNAAVFMKGEFGEKIKNVTLEGNHFIGGGWTVYTQGTGNKIINNTFEGGGYGPISVDDTPAQFSGNKDKNGKTINA